MKKGLLLLLSFFALWGAKGSGVEVALGSLPDAQHLKFELSWEYAWNLENVAAPFNHDAVWVFIKYQEAQGPWLHLDLSDLNSDHNSDNPQIRVDAVADQKGVMVRLANSGTGDVAPSSISVTLANALPYGDYRFRIFAVEMVVVKAEPFWLGDSLSNHAFTGTDSLNPVQITSENALPQGTVLSRGNLPPAANIPTEWPKGVAAFYCMKYEISQDQYKDFLNCLSYAQQSNRSVTDPASSIGTLALNNGPSHRNGIRIQQASVANQPAVYGLDGDNDGNFAESDDGKDRACNFLNWEDLTAWLAWAGLRPLTEFEYEKACRGPVTPRSLEFGWGSPGITDANTLSLDGEAGEGVSDQPAAGSGLASHGYAGPQGPLRCGFAALDSSDRLRSGASWYGIMEMSGNLWEQCISVNSNGLAFLPDKGNGALTLAGNAAMSNWPAASGAIYRGGGWNSGILPGFRDLAVSDRYYAGSATDQRRNTTGGRGGR